MFATIKVFVNFGAAQAKIRTQVNYSATEFQQRRGILRRHTVRQSQENHLRLPREPVRVGLAETQRLCPGMVCEAREYLRERLPGILPRRHGQQVNLRVRKQQTNQL